MIDINDFKKKYGCEMALLILCCRVFFETATTSELKIFVADNDINWDKLLKLAKIHRIRPTVYKIIQTINLPDSIKAVISKQLMQIVKLNWQQAIETERIILLLNKDNIDAVPYKGAVFSRQFFGDLISRESSDIDLVIKPTDLERAVQILKRDEYLPELDDVYQYLGPKFQSYNKDYNFNKFNNNSRIYHLELHWAIAENYMGISNRVNQFLYHTNTRAELAKTNVKALNEVSHFSAILIHHAVKDTFRTLKNIVDLAQAMRYPQIKNNAQTLNKQFESLSLKKAFELSNTLTENLIGVALPVQPSQLVTNKLNSHFTDQLCSGNPMLAEDNKTILACLKNRSLLQDSSMHKLRFYLISFRQRFIPGEIDFRLVELPKSVFFIYYLIKPLRSLIKPFDAVEKKKKLQLASLVTKGSNI